MLIEIRSKVLRLGKIPFGPSLNVILGDDNATNSIGKSTLLMLVDFAMGGQSMLDHHTDLVAELGHHDYYFTFVFDNEFQRFRRGTLEPSVVYKCDENDLAIAPLTIEGYTSYLKQLYQIGIDDLSFRSLVGLYLRVWGKDNLLVDQPLQSFPAQPPRESIDTLLKTFDRYSSIRELTELLSKKDEEKKAHSVAKKHGIVSSIGKRQYFANETRIAELESEIEDIRANLARYSTDLSEVVSKQVLKLKVRKDQMLEARSLLAGRLERIRHNLVDSRNIKSKSFQDLEPIRKLILKR